MKKKIESRNMAIPRKSKRLTLKKEANYYSPAKQRVKILKKMREKFLQEGNTADAQEITEFIINRKQIVPKWKEMYRENEKGASFRSKKNSENDNTLEAINFHHALRQNSLDSKVDRFLNGKMHISEFWGERQFSRLNTASNLREIDRLLRVKQMKIQGKFENKFETPMKRSEEEKDDGDEGQLSMKKLMKIIEKREQNLRNKFLKEDENQTISISDGRVLRPLRIKKFKLKNMKTPLRANKKQNLEFTPNNFTLRKQQTNTKSLGRLLKKKKEREFIKRSNLRVSKLLTKCRNTVNSDKGLKVFYNTNSVTSLTSFDGKQKSVNFPKYKTRKRKLSFFDIFLMRKIVKKNRVELDRERLEFEKGSEFGKWKRRRTRIYDPSFDIERTTKMINTDIKDEISKIWDEMSARKAKQPQTIV